MGTGIDSLYARLGLPPGAALDDVRRAYRRLALRAHPDLHRDQPDAHDRFVEIATAYRQLSDALRAPDAAPPRCCPLCGACAPLYTGTDGRDCCGACLLGRARRLLPHPMMVQVRFVGVFALLLLAAVLLMRGMRTDAWAWHVAALTLVGAAMAWLAAVTIRTVHVYDRRLPVSSAERRACRG